MLLVRPRRRTGKNVRRLCKKGDGLADLSTTHRHLLIQRDEALVQRALDVMLTVVAPHLTDGAVAILQMPQYAVK